MPLPTRAAGAWGPTVSRRPQREPSRSSRRFRSVSPTPCDLLNEEGRPRDAAKSVSDYIEACRIERPGQLSARSIERQSRERQSRKSTIVGGPDEGRSSWVGGLRVVVVVRGLCRRHTRPDGKHDGGDRSRQGREEGAPGGGRPDQPFQRRLGPLLGYLLRVAHGGDGGALSARRCDPGADLRLLR